MKYRSEIDGLRALAVIPVILFHAKFDLFSGGFIGVDIFFVISGYLITSIIQQEIKNNTFSIIHFYERRIRRILPALFFVSLICIPFAWLWLFPDEYKSFSKSLVAVNLFASNILFWSESGYFSPASELTPLLHTWSLAVEEQFYMFFPLILLLFRKTRESTLLILLITIAVLSLMLSEYSSIHYPDANFYLLPTRIWELGAGAILAISLPHWKQVKPAIAQLLSLLGISMVIASIFFFDETIAIPSSFGLIPVIGTLLIIAYAAPQNITGKILSWKPMVSIGLISYSAYLWHQPLFAFARIRSLNALSTETYLTLSAAALVLAYLTWRFIEAPFRKKNKFSTPQVFSVAAIISALFIGFGLLGYAKSGLPERLPSEVYNKHFSAELPARRDDCLIAPNDFSPPPKKECIYNANFQEKIALWGDSHAEAIAEKLAQRLAQDKKGLIQLTYSDCPPVMGYKRSDRVSQCNRFNTETFQYLKNSPIQTVILLSRWALPLNGERFNNQEGGIEHGRNLYGLPITKDTSFIHDKKRIPEVGKLYRATITALLNAGKKVVLIYPIPEVGWNVPKYLAKKQLHYATTKEQLSSSFAVFKQRTRNAYTQLGMLNKHPNLLTIYPEKVFCNTAIQGRCMAESDNKPLYFDDDHLNNFGSDMLTQEILEHIKSKGWL